MTVTRRLQVLRELYAPFIEDAPFCLELSYMGCAAFLGCLKHDVCDQGDTLLRHDALHSTMYILVHGEVVVETPVTQDPADPTMARLSSRRASGGRRDTRRGSAAVGADGASNMDHAHALAALKSGKSMQDVRADLQKANAAPTMQVRAGGA